MYRMSNTPGTTSPEHHHEAGQENEEDNPPTAPMDGSLVKSGEMSLEHARKAVQEFKEVNIPKAQLALVKACKGAGRHMKLINDQILRCLKTEEYYKEQEEMLTRKINDALAIERSVESERSAEQSRLSYERNQLSSYESELRSAESRRDEAKSKRAEAEMKRDAATAGAVLLGLITFGAGTAVTGAATAAAAAAAASFNEDEKAAEREISQCNDSISSARQKVSQYEGSVSTLTNRIAQLNSEKARYNQQRSQMQQEKGRIKGVIAFLCDAQKFGQEFSDTTEHARDHTYHMALITRMAQQTKDYRLFDSQGTELVLKSFEEAWDAFEEMNIKGTNYQFKIDF